MCRDYVTTLDRTMTRLYCHIMFYQAVMERLSDASARGLAEAVSRAVGDGALAGGLKLPPVRSVATELQLSPSTVNSAWQLLRRAGTIRTDGRRGTVVAT